MEAGKKWVTVLTPEGEFCKIHNRYGHYLEGQEIFFKETADQPGWTRIFGLRRGAWREWGMTAAVFAILLLLFVPLLQGWLNPRVMAYVSVDINPSLEIGIDRDYQVIEAYAYNSEGERILAAIPWKGASLAAVTSSILDEADKQGYFIKSNQVLISTIPVDLPDDHSKQQITEQIAEVVKQRTSLHVVTLEGDSNIHDKAKEEGLSSGKYVVWQALQDSGVKLTREQMKKQSVNGIGLVVGDIDKVKELVKRHKVALNQPEKNDKGSKDNHNKNKQLEDNTPKNNPPKNNQTEDKKTKGHEKFDKNEGKRDGDKRTVPGKKAHSPSPEMRIPSNEGWNPTREFLERHAKEKKPKNQGKDGKKKDNRQNDDEENKKNGKSGQADQPGKPSKSNKSDKSGKSDKQEK